MHEYEYVGCPPVRRALSLFLGLGLQAAQVLVTTRRGAVRRAASPHKTAWEGQTSAPLITDYEVHVAGFVWVPISHVRTPYSAGASIVLLVLRRYEYECACMMMWAVRLRPSWLARLFYRPCQYHHPCDLGTPGGAQRKRLQRLAKLADATPATMPARRNGREEKTTQRSKLTRPRGQQAPTCLVRRTLAGRRCPTRTRSAAFFAARKQAIRGAGQRRLAYEYLLVVVSWYRRRRSYECDPGRCQSAKGSRRRSLVQASPGLIGWAASERTVLAEAERQGANNEWSWCTLYDRI